MRNLFYQTQIGSGQVTAGDPLTLTVPPAEATHYHDAQIADYTLQDRDFKWQQPGAAVQLTVRAHFTVPDVRGTAGFGFWNHPFSPEMRGLPRLPQAAWFFYGSPPNDMPLAKGVPGHGWKCATINVQRWPFFALAPLAPPGFLLMRVPALYNRLWPLGQDAIGVRERLLSQGTPTETHDYTLTWQQDRVTFAVDGSDILTSPFAIRGRMGFIAWVDNQYAVVTPQGRFGWGLVDVPLTQSLILEHIAIHHV